MIVKLRHRHLRPAGFRPKNEPYSTLRDESLKAEGPPLTIAVGRSSATAVISVRGELGDRDAPALEAVLAETFSGQDHLDVVVDLRRVTHASPAAVAMLATAAAQATERGIGFRLSEPPAPLTAELEAAGLAYAIDVVGVDPAPTWVTSLRVS